MEYMQTNMSVFVTAGLTYVFMRYALVMISWTAFIERPYPYFAGFLNAFGYILLKL